MVKREKNTVQWSEKEKKTQCTGGKREKPQWTVHSNFKNPKKS